jgi:hypothetical protein
MNGREKKGTAPIRAKHPSGRSGKWVLSPFFALLLSGLSVRAADEPAPWTPPAAEAVRKDVLAWLAGQKPEAPLRASAEKLWAGLPPRPQATELLSRAAETFSLADPRAKKLVERCWKPYVPGPVGKEEWLRDPKTPPLVAKNLRLYYARWLAQQSLFDEALEQLAGLEPGNVIDPASLLFCRALAHYRLADREPGLKAAERLLANSQQCPRRYKALGEMMREDLKRLEDETLDHISRRMDDIRRRLALGRGGPKVRKIEDGVVASLDKLIKEIEDRLQEQSGAAGGSSIRPDKPAGESRPMGGKGPGEVVQRNVGAKSGWGNLPPKEREEAMQQVGREFPAHYREVIEQYFRRLAAEGEKAP